MITIEEKDKVLAFICSHEVESVHFVALREWAVLQISEKSIVAILRQMERQGLVEEVSYSSCLISFLTRTEAHDFVRHGGYFAQEELLTKNIKKLILEIEELKPKFPEKAAAIASITSGIATALGLFLK